MLHRVLTAMAAALCVIVISGSAFAHPNYPGLSQAHSGKSAQGIEHKSVKAKRAGAGNHLAIAARDLGTNPTKQRRLWCAVWLNRIEKKAGRPGTGSALAKSFASYGRKVARRNIQPGDIVVLGRRGGGHVGYALGPIRGGKIKLRSGNTSGKGPGRRIVADGFYSASRIIAVRRPS